MRANSVRAPGRRKYAVLPKAPATAIRGKFLQYRINRSALQVVLEQWERDLAAPQPVDVAQRMGQWLSPMDAVQLNTALHTIESHAGAAAKAAGRAVDADAVQALYQAGCDELDALVATVSAPEPAPRGRAARLGVLPVVEAATAPELAPRMQRYQFVRQQFVPKVAALRARLRQHLARGSAGQQQLAALDAVMEQMLGAQEHKLWGRLPSFLERRWKQRSTSQGAAAAGTAWLRGFEQDMQALLNAELQVRLQPVQGLVQAARNGK